MTDKLQQLRDAIAEIGKERTVRVLVVDDVESDRELIRRELASYRIIADEVVGGEEAVKTLRQRHYDVVFMDVKMPGLSGVDTMRRLKTENVNATIFLCTEYKSFPGLSEALELGVIRVIDKSVLADALREIFEPLCRKI